MPRAIALIALGALGFARWTCDEAIPRGGVAAFTYRLRIRARDRLAGLTPEWHEHDLIQPARQVRHVQLESRTGASNRIGSTTVPDDGPRRLARSGIVADSRRAVRVYSISVHRTGLRCINLQRP